MKMIEHADSTTNPTQTKWFDASEERPGLQVWSTAGRLEELAFSLVQELTLDGERVIAIDASRCFEPSNAGKYPAATNLRVIRVENTGELQTALWTVLRDGSSATRTHRVLLTGVLEQLYGTDLLTRDAARVLGRIKIAMDAMVRAGMEVVVACRASSSALGVRSYFLSSLCAVADQVHVFPSASQQYVDSTTSAIA